MPTCDCADIEAELAQMELEVQEAQENRARYQNELEIQQDYTQMLLDAANWVSDLIQFDDIRDLVSFVADIAGIAALIIATNKGMAAKAAAIVVAKAIAVVLVGLIASAAASLALEAFFRNRVKYWSNELEERQEAYKKIEGRLTDCESSLTECNACGEEYVDKTECGRECGGCREWYCAHCFDDGIESAELAAGEAF